MPRKLRDQTPGGVYHVYARGNRRAPIFGNDDDRRQYLLMWGGVAVEADWRCLAYCLMDNHVHHLVELTSPNLSEGVQQVHGSYGRYFNEQHRKTGHVFQGRYGSVRAASAGTLWYFASYIVLNPVRAGMCSRPEDHPWSSHRSTVGSTPAPAWLDARRLLEHFDPAPGDALRRYEQIVEAVRILGVAGFEPAPSRLEGRVHEPRECPRQESNLEPSD